nr:membrane-bound lytic murein transglycosylase MltF [Catenovulum maritimum]
MFQLILGIKILKESISLQKSFNFDFIKTCLGIVICCLVLVSCKTEQAQSQYQKIIQSKQLKIGTLFGSTSYFLTADGATGFEYELAKHFADYLDVELVVVPVYDLSELFALLDSGQVDLLAANLTRTPDREKQYRFSPSYLKISEKLIFKQGNIRPRKWEDLNGKLIIAANSTHAQTVEDNAPESLDWQVTSDLDSEELIQAVLDEEIDYTIVDSNLLAVNRRISPELSIGFSVSKEQQIAWVFNQESNDELFAKLIDFFGAINQDGSFAYLEDKHFGHVRDFDYVDTRQFLKAIEKTLPKYQGWFEQYAGQYKLDWRLLAAQSYQESHWNPRAKSPTGVRGIMMLTQPTAKQVGVKSRLNAEDNIRGGAQYLASLMKRIPARIQDPDRTWFALAAYNIGLGHLEDARRITESLGSDPDKWHQVKKHLPFLQKKKYYKFTRYGYARGNEAVNYVENIRRYYDSLSWFYGLQTNTSNMTNTDAKPEDNQTN